VFSFIITFTITTAKPTACHIRVLTINMDSKTSRCKNIAKYDVWCLSDAPVLGPWWL